MLKENIWGPWGASVSRLHPCLDWYSSAHTHWFSKRETQHGPKPPSHSKGDSPCNKTWWTVSNVPLRLAKFNHCNCCSDSGSPVAAYLALRVRSGNPTKWQRCVTAWDNETPCLTINKAVWLDGNSSVEFLKAEGMLWLDTMLSMWKHGW